MPVRWTSLSVHPPANMNFESLRGEGARHNFRCEPRETLFMYQMLIVVGVILAKTNGKYVHCRRSSNQGKYCYVSLVALINRTPGHRLVSWTLPETSISICHLNILWR